MTIGLGVTIVLAILTATGTFDLSLFQILLPMLIELALGLLLFLTFGSAVFSTFRKTHKRPSRRRSTNRFPR